MSNEGMSKKRSRSSFNDGDDVSSHHQKSKRIPSSYVPAISATPLIVNNSTQDDDAVADVGRIHHALSSSATGAPPAATSAQPTLSLSASRPACYAPYVWPRQKRNQVATLNCTPMKDGDTWYLISRTWYEKWQAACNPALRTHRRGADDRIGPVDNSDIVGTNGELIPGLSEGNSVYCVSQPVMDLFTQWYGTPKYPIARKVVSDGNYSAKHVEFYPYKIKTYWMSKMKRHLPSSQPTHTIHISRTAPVSELLARVSEKWGKITPARFWHTPVNSLEQDPVNGIFYSSNRIRNDSTQPFATTEVDKTRRLDEVGLEDGDAIIMETMHGEEWTIDLDMTTLGQRISRPKTQEPQVAVFIEEYLAKYRSDRTIKLDISGLYSFTHPGPSYTTTDGTAALGERINRPKAQEPKVAVFAEEQMAVYRNHRPDSVTGIGIGGGVGLGQPRPSTTVGPLGTMPPLVYPSPGAINGARMNMNGIAFVPGTSGVGAGVGGHGSLPIISNVGPVGNQLQAATRSVQQMQGANKPSVAQFAFHAITPGYPQPPPAMPAGQPPQSRLGQLGGLQQQPYQMPMHSGAPTNPFHTLKLPIIQPAKAPSSAKPAHYPVPSGSGAASGPGIMGAKKEGAGSQQQRQSQVQTTVNQTPLLLGTGTGAIAGGMSNSFNSSSSSSSGGSSGSGSGGSSSNLRATAKPSANLPSAGLEFDFNQLPGISDLFSNNDFHFPGLEFMNSADDTFMFLNMPESMDGNNLLG